MTTRKPWPYAAQHARDQAAQKLQVAERKLRPLLVVAPTSMPEHAASITIAYADIVEGLRWLESAGAQTRPCERVEQ